MYYLRLVRYYPVPKQIMLPLMLLTQQPLTFKLLITFMICLFVIICLCYYLPNCVEESHSVH